MAPSEPISTACTRGSAPWRARHDGRALADGSGLIALDMPYRAEDAAVVPLTMRIPSSAGE